MLTDLHDFFIFCYDGSKFCLYQDEISVPTHPRSAFLRGMINGLLAVTFVIKDYINCHIVTEILFSVILQGYIQTLQAVSTRSKYRGIHGDVCAVVLASFASSTHYRFQHTARQRLGQPSLCLLRNLCISFTFCSSTCWANVQKSRPSLNKWNKALSAAKIAQNLLSHVDCTSLDKWERSAAEGLLWQFLLDTIMSIGDRVAPCTWTNT